MKATFWNNAVETSRGTGSIRARRVNGEVLVRFDSDQSLEWLARNKINKEFRRWQFANKTYSVLRSKLPNKKLRCGK